MSEGERRAVIELDKVDKYFGAHPAVLDLSFSVFEGEIVALLGRTGAGKSTALHMIMGVMRDGCDIRDAVDRHTKFGGNTRFAFKCTK